MVSANEAKRRTQNNVNICVTQELNKLEEQISNAIANGEFFISNNGTLQKETRSRLESLGYKIETGSQYNEAYYSVNWS